MRARDDDGAGRVVLRVRVDGDAVPERASVAAVVEKGAAKGVAVTVTETVTVL